LFRDVPIGGTFWTPHYGVLVECRKLTANAARRVASGETCFPPRGRVV
jgi:hypothetical protein